MRKLILTLVVLALPLTVIGFDGHTQSESDPFWITFQSFYHAPPEFLTVSVFGNGGDIDQFNFGGLDLVSSNQGFAVNQEFSDEFTKIGASSEDCDNGLQILGSALYKVEEIRVGQRWEGNVVQGENRSICVDLTADPELGGDYLIFQIRMKLNTDGTLIFNAYPDSITAAFNNTQYSPINVLIHKVEVDVPNS